MTDKQLAIYLRSVLNLPEEEVFKQLEDDIALLVEE